MISQLGQSQDGRLPPELDPFSRDFIAIDERSITDLLGQARALAEKLRFYRNDPGISSGDWSEFFPECDETLLLRNDGQVTPHLGMFAAFLGLYRYPQQALNTFASRHMAFQFRDVLRFVPKPAKPDNAHVLLELKKGVPPIVMAPDCEFSAGKDASGSELIYRPVRETLIGHAQVEALHNVFHNRDGIFFAPVANSSDGLGGALDKTSPKWRAFGGSDLPPAHIGCAFSSPVLRMQEGSRTVKTVLTLSGINAAKYAPRKLADAFEAYLTGPKGWLGPLDSSDVSLSADTLSLSFSVAADAPAVVDYNSDVHGYAFAAQAPVLQLLLKTDADLHYDDVRNLTLQSAQLFVTVRDLQTLALENDEGSLNPKKAFLPFGAQPVTGSRFMIGCEEALGKQLTDLKIHLSWLKAPSSLTDWYTGYTNKGKMSNGIDARLIYQNHGGSSTHDVEQTLLSCNNDGTSTLGPRIARAAPQQKRHPESWLFALLSAGSTIARLLGNRFRMERPIYQNATAPQVSARNGYLTIALSEDFLHADYRKETVYNTINKVQDSQKNVLVLNEPYTPKVQSISLDYDAHSDKTNINIRDDFAAQDLQFFHVGCFGQRREHAFLRAQISPSLAGSIPLLPEYPDEGEFLIGIGGAAAGDSLSLLLQVAEDSADPTLEAAPVTWSVLCDNYWRTLTPQNLTLDTSNKLRASGIVATSLPQETSITNTWMPSGKVWLRASIANNSAAACQLFDVAANAVEVQLAAPTSDMARPSSRLAPEKISKLKTPRPEVKSVAQRYAGFGGHPPESDSMLTRRAAERLRHRNRCITPWDYERMLLEAFPNAHKVKCIPHASEDSWLAPGRVMLVVIPDLRNLDAADMREPRVDIDTLSRMEDYLWQHAGMFGGNVNDGNPRHIRVRNPQYQRVRLDFKVRLMPGLSFNYYHHKLQQDLLAVLMPWAYDKKRDIEFGGRIYRSVLLNFVEELPYVDFVTDFRMGVLTSDNTPLHDTAEISADRPDVVFTSSSSHTITEYTDT